MTPNDAALFRRSDLPDGFDRWELSLAPGAARPSYAAEWDGCLVLVESGTLEVECAAGGRRSFPAGALLALGWLPLRTIRNPSTIPARLLAIRRRPERPAIGR